MLKNLVTLFFLILFVTCSIFANNKTAPQNGWNFTLAPYAWLSWANGNITINNQTSSLNYTPKDISNVLDSALMLHLEVSKGNWSVVIDPIYVKLSQNISSTLFTFKQTTIDSGLYYKFMNKAHNNNRLTGEIVAGVRYWRLKAQLSALLGSISKQQEWTDPIIGARFIYAIGKKWHLIGYGDIGGFGWVSHFTWQIKAITIYNFNQYIGLGVGFKALDVNYSQHTKNGKFKYDTFSFGPLVGLVFTF